MSARTPRIFLTDILACMERIAQYTTGITQAEFENRPIVVDAVLRNLEIIGEASRNIPEDLRANYPHIPWTRMVGLRNIVIHAYFNVDLEIVWQIISVNLPATKAALEEMQAQISSSK